MMPTQKTDDSQEQPDVTDEDDALEVSEQAPADPPATEEILSQISCKVKLDSYQRLTYFAMKRSLQAGKRVTLGQVAGEVLEQAASQLPEPPADLLN